jgi:hypothetical protein
MHHVRRDLRAGINLICYDAEKFEETLALVDNTSPYALTGAILSAGQGSGRTRYQ